MHNHTTTTGTTYIDGGSTYPGSMNMNFEINPRTEGPVTIEKMNKYKVDIDLDDESLESITFKYKDKKHTLNREEFKSLKGLLNL